MASSSRQGSSPETPEAPPKPFHPDLVWREEVLGPRPGDRAVRLARHRSFRRAGTDAIEAREDAITPRGGLSRAFWRAKRFLIGQPISTADEIHERLTKVKALAVLSSDAMSSVAYGPEAVMRTVILAGVGALSLTMPINVVIALLLAIVATSYRQTIRAYPSGGGSYIVAHENLGVLPGLIAAAALLIDYVLTVAVSVAAGVDALKSALPALRAYDTELAVVTVVLIAIVNLRGIRESGSIFAAPTYVFVISVLAMIGVGLFRTFTTGIPYTPGPQGASAGTEPLTLFLLLSAFARGCTAMTGTEAISNGVPAFQRPESQNARATLTWMAILLGSMLLGIAFLVSHIGLIPDPTEQETVLSQLTRLVVGNGPFYFVVTLSTTLILFLAANTSYADFPRLLSILARDRFAPRWFASRGDRLAFSMGIFALTLFSCVLLLVFGSNVQNLLPLYAVGVFTSFTLSQSGMVMHWLRERQANWKRSAVINGVGAVMTAVVTLIIGYTKFLEGAWIAIAAAIILVLFFLRINRHYLSFGRQLRSDAAVRPTGQPPLVLVPVAGLSRVARESLAFAQDLSTRVVAAHVAADLKEAEALRKEWHEATGDIPLVIIESPYRLLNQPLLAYVDALREMDPNGRIVVLLPEFVTKRWWEHLLHNQTALRLKASLLYRPGVVVVSYPYHLVD